MKAIGRNLPGHRKRVLNSAEKKYLREVLEPRKNDGEIVDWWFECVKFHLAKDTTWTPDFMVLYADGTVEFVDVKGTRVYDEQAQRVKIKLAAERYYLFRFVVAKQQTKKNGGGFKIEELD